MARRLRYPSLESRTARLKLVVRSKPYPGPKLASGTLLLYRRNKANSSWVLKARNGNSYWTKVIAEADDFDANNGETILTFDEAQDIAKQLARGGKTLDTTAPATFDRALIDYKTDLISRGADPCNAQNPRRHLTSCLLAKPVALLTSKELKTWRDSCSVQLLLRPSTESAMHCAPPCSWPPNMIRASGIVRHGSWALPPCPTPTRPAMWF